jgi:hypothetical protein
MRANTGGQLWAMGGTGRGADADRMGVGRVQKAVCVSSVARLPLKLFSSTRRDPSNAEAHRPSPQCRVIHRIPLLPGPLDQTKITYTFVLHQTTPGHPSIQSRYQSTELQPTIA